MEEPAKHVFKTLHVDPNFTRANAEMVEPARKYDRTLKLLPMWMASMTEIVLPNLVMPYIDTVEPNLQKLRTEYELPDFK
jgi:hypothetical protein